MQPDPTVEEALRECEEACPNHNIITYENGVRKPCGWPGHAAIARLRETAEKAGYERGYCEGEGRERNRLWEAKQAEVNR